MTHASEDFLSAPAHLVLQPRDGDVAGDTAIRLLVKGQGTVGFAIAEKSAFHVEIRTGGWDPAAFRWDVDFDGVRLREYFDGEWHPKLAERGVGLDPEPLCPYWFSIDTHNRILRFGKGEMRLGCAIASYDLPPKPADGADPYAWLAATGTVSIGAAIRGSIDVWRDPVLVEPPMYVVRHDAITMDQMAAGAVTVPANLTPTCQQLYDNVAGEAFVLASDDFPDFAAAIKRSILDENGWCHKTLVAKAAEFGKPDLERTYLRITMGQNQGESPGIPFVMEIWPSNHFSPIHNHGASDAVIKVLHGEITVDLYPMLSASHVTPFATRVFRQDDVTWVSPRLNQVHKLINRNPDEPCITIQCYMYAQSNDTHWPYLDYLNDTGIAHFDPNSDDDYLGFKARMKAEWDQRPGT